MNRVSRLLVALLLLAPLTLSATIRLLNDSPYPLIAKIYNRQGRLVGVIKVPPKNLEIWYDDQSPYSPQPNFPYTPYSVSWICNLPENEEGPGDKEAAQQEGEKYEFEYASWSGIPPGGTVTASLSPEGVHYCRVKKKKPEPKEPNWTENRAKLPTNPNQGAGNEITNNQYDND